MPIVNWVKNNKFVTVVIIVVAYLLLSLSRTFFGVNINQLSIPSQKMGAVELGSDVYSGAPGGIGISRSEYMPPSPDYAPQPDIENRLVIKESNLSLLVKDVVDSRNKILDYTKTSGGYMVSSNVSNPQDAPTATLVIRVPSDKLESALDYFHSLSVKVVSENLSGRDVTDQYVDIDARLKTLQATKERFESILAQATKIEDITNLTQRILNTQNQIDAYKGQQESLKQNAQLAKLTIYLSTDELALPYAPSETFRPNVIFKLAVRSLIGFARTLATYAIWIGVYSIIWVPALGIFIAIKRWKKRKMGS